MLDLPWFLYEAKPAGFLGEAWLRAHPDHGYPRDLRQWTGDDVLRFALYYGDDLPGALVIGHHARDRVRRGLDLQTIPERERHLRFPEWAEQVMAGVPIGSSPGGEQPKFTARIEDRAVMVKFSPPRDTPAGERWADLLAAEHTAHQVLHQFGHPTPNSTVIDAGGRRFLEIGRFDRHGARGRSGQISLFPFDKDGAGSDLRSWSIPARFLFDEGRISQNEYKRIAWLESFGHLIANTDMHLGNLSLRLRGTTIEGLAPVYDMLPMAHRPRFGGEVRHQVYDPYAQRDTFPDSAKAAARNFWTAVVSRDDVSDGFRVLCTRQREKAR
jgi:hypothetical protein